MRVSLYVRAYSTDGIPSPEICNIEFDDAMATRLKTLSSMVQEFSLENISDRCEAIWRDPEWMREYTLCAPLVFATRCECWWSVEVVTETGAASFQTERINIQRLIEACGNAVGRELIYTEVNPAQVAARIARFGQPLT